jgi:hypothetical protein
MLFSARLDTALTILDELPAHLWTLKLCPRNASRASKWCKIGRRPMKRLLLIAGVLPSSLSERSGVVRVDLRPERVRDHLITAVSERFAGRVDVDSAMVSIYPRPAITGSRLRIQLRNADPRARPVAVCELLPGKRTVQRTDWPAHSTRQCHLWSAQTFAFRPVGSSRRRPSLDNDQPVRAAPRGPFIHRD